MTKHDDVLATLRLFASDVLEHYGFDEDSQEQCDWCLWVPHEGDHECSLVTISRLLAESESDD